MNADKIHAMLNLLMGMAFPRAWVRKLSLNKRLTLCKWAHNYWARANDNNVKVIKKPRWVPKKFLWG